jgi:shikimate dehydrogenase
MLRDARCNKQGAWQVTHNPDRIFTMSSMASPHSSISGTTRLIVLLGYPVGHSLSPAMHNAALASIGFDARYELLPVKPDDLESAVALLRDPKYLGANVTLPHKSAVIPFLDEISPLARTLGAVNTIVRRDDGTLFGDTTDAAGFIAAFEDAGYSFEGKSVAILGNGGSARTIAIGLPLKRNVTRLTLVARSVSKAAALAEEIRAAAPHADVTALSVEDYAKVRQDYDIVVNTTPVGMTPNVDETPLPAALLDPHQIVYDIVYNPLETRLLHEAKARGCRTVGGLGMPVHQGKLAFEQWTGKNVDAEVFYEGIRQKKLQEAGSTV